MKNTFFFIFLFLISCTQDSVLEDDPGQMVYVKCSNTLTDADMINEAIANSSKGAEIVIGGQCLINKEIKLIGDRSYRGESLGTIIKQADDANLAALLASDSFLENTNYTGTPVSVRQFTLDGNKVNNTQKETSGIILRSWLSNIENMQIINMGGDGLKITNLSSNGTELSTSQVNGRISGNFITDSGRNGIFIEDTQNAVTDWFLVDNWIAESGIDGIHINNAAGWMISRNHIYGVPQNAIYAHRLFGTSISDNYIEGFGETTKAGNWHGIFTTVQGEAASTIFANRVFNFGLENSGINLASNYRYISISANYDTGIVSLVGNTVRGADTDLETGLYFTTNPNASLNVTSTGNVVENVKTKQFVDDQVTINP